MAKRQKSNWDNLTPQKSSAAQFITYVASVGGVDERYEIRYEDENIWMSQKILAQVYGVEINTVNYHIKKIFADAELDENSVIRKIRITGSDGKMRLEKFLELFDQHAPKYAGDPVDAYKAQLYAESEFEKYRIVQDKLFMSDYDRYLLALEEQVKKEKGK